ncbi:MAG: hypothetical protein ABH850_01700 [Candidatus Micrarchaeota archaeon]
MSIRLRIEFLLPLTYNNGKDVEPKKFFKIKEEIMKQFGGISIHPLSIEGGWINKADDIVYYDNCKRFEVCVEKSDESRKWIAKYKEKLKKEFQQHEIYMISTEVEKI